MKIFDKILENYVLPYQFKEEIREENLLFFDIETTGFTARSSDLYLIGCAYKEGENWHIKQFFAENASEQADIIKAFFELAGNYTHLVHFNGNQFDLPYVTQKCEQFSLSYNFDNFSGIDIYKRINPYKYFLKLPNCKQKTIEHFLGIDREDMYTGGELIKIYKDYTENPSEEALNLLILHNFEDIQGMLQIVSVLVYHDLFNDDIKTRKVQINSYSDVNGIIQKELFMKEALKQARQAYNKLEVPVGAVIVKDGKIIARAYNQKEYKASKKLNSWRLIDCEMYVTLEPCSMCAGALIQSRIKKVYIGAPDLKTGACGSVLNLLQDYKFNHFVEIEQGVLKDECENILKDFFVKLRNIKKKGKN